MIKRLTRLNLSYNGEVYTYISEYRAIKYSFTKLGISVDDILLYFVWNFIPKAFQNQFVHINNTNNPTLKQIDDSIFEAADRFCSIRRNPGNKSQSSALVAEVEDDTTGLAAKVSVKPRQKTCSLCASDKAHCDHAIYNCTRYPTADDKIAKLKALKACLACGFSNHYARDCTCFCQVLLLCPLGSHQLDDALL